MRYPCQDCIEDRYPGCHDHCEKYIQVARQAKAAKKQAQRGKEADAYLCVQVLAHKDRMAKHKKQFPGSSVGRV